MFEGRRKEFVKGRRKYLGYSDARAKRLDSYAAEKTVNASPQLCIYSDAVLVPLKKIGKDSFAGGVYLPKGYPPYLQHERGGRYFWQDTHGGIAPKADSEIDEAWLGGPLIKHYGHFILESLARLLDQRIINSHLPIVFLALNPVESLPRLTQWMRDLFSHLGIDPARIRICRETTLVRNLQVLCPLFAPRTVANVSARLSLIKNSPEINDFREIVYLSRSKVRTQRSFHDEKLIEDVVRAAGGTVVFPENLSVHQQISTINQARTIIGLEGSALHNIVFAKEFKNLIILCPGDPTETFRMVDELFDGDTFYIDGWPGDDATRRNWWVTPLMLDRLAFTLDALKDS